MTVTLVRGFQDPDSKSKGLSWIQKDPDDRKDYLRDWADVDDPFLDIDNDETISDVEWVVQDNSWVVLEGDDGELIVSASPYQPTNTDTTTTVWLEGGTAGVSYLVTCRVTTSAGRIADDSFQVRVIQR